MVMVPKTKRNYLRKPDWLKINRASEDHYSHTGNVVSKAALNTICASGKCPNQAECWSRGTATFMICGNVCTRACRFCATQSGIPDSAPDPVEPVRLAASIEEMGLKYAVITSVDRDDLDDFGASHWAECVRTIKERTPNTTIEVLIPDFQGELECVQKVLDAHPDVVGHNLETVRRLTPKVRHRATYDCSMKVLEYIVKQGYIAKTGIMVGLGETFDEVVELMKQVAGMGVSTLTIGQYLQPTLKHYPVAEYIHPDVFKKYKEIGEDLGIVHVESAPLVRSSYHADDHFKQANRKKKLNLSDL